MQPQVITADPKKATVAEQEAAAKQAAALSARARLLAAVKAANAAGTVAIAGYYVYDHEVATSGGYSSMRVSDTEDPEVAAVCSRKRAERAASQAKEARLEQLPAKPVDYPATTTLDGTYLFDVPSGHYGDAWAKHVTNIDPAGRGGFALEGRWLREKAALPIGEVVVVGSKTWSGSRRSGEWLYDVAVYVATPANLCRVWRGDSTDQAVAKCRALLDQSATERVAEALAARLATCDKHLATLAGLDPAEYAGEAEVIAECASAWQTLRDRLQAALDGGAGDERICDVDSAAAAIVAAGYRALAQEHHPDHGGSHETMAHLNEAKRQLRELLKLASEVTR